VSRDLTTAMADAVAASTVRPILLFEATFSNDTGYYWTGFGDLDWNGHTWKGVGDLIAITPADETDDVQGAGITVSAKAIQSADVAKALAELANGQAGSIRLGLLDEAGALIAEPKIVFRGRLDVGEIDDGDPENPLVNLRYEHELVDLERAREWRYTSQHQEQLYSGDTGLKGVAALQDVDIIWGRR